MADNNTIKKNPGNQTETINAQLAAVQGQNPQDGEYPYVIFQLFENKFAINCKYVVTIEQVSETTEMVNSSNDVRGIAYYKNEPMSVYDLRSILGLMSHDEYIRNVADIPSRIAEHEAYAQTLVDCVGTGEAFRIGTDSTKCNFGKWFYDYRNKVVNIEIRKELDKTQIVHEKFYKAAKIVKDYVARGRLDEAAAHVDDFENAKNELVQKLNDLNQMLLETVTELNIILQMKGKKIGLIVDAADSVDEIDEIQPLPPSVVMTKYVKRMGLDKKDKQIIFILEAAEFEDQQDQQ